VNKGRVVVLEWNNFDCPFVKEHYASGKLPKLQGKFIAEGVVWLTVNSGAKDKQGYQEPARMAERAAREGNRATHFLIDSEGSMGKARGAASGQSPGAAANCERRSLTVLGRADSNPPVTTLKQT
jgi:hypothetical protein